MRRMTHSVNRFVHLEFFRLDRDREGLGRAGDQHSHEEVLARYGQAMVMCERMPEIFSAAMGNQMYTVKLDRFEDVQAFIAFVHAKQRE